MPNSPKMLIYKQLQIDILACNSSTRTDICFQKHALMFYATSHGMDELLREIMLINRLLLIFYSRSVKIKKTTVISEKEIIAMENTKIDRRVRKTKALLLKGLTQLMEEKDVNHISVRELTDLVDLNRGTFYLHYRDIFDMVNQVEDELFQQFDELFHENASGDDSTTTTLTVLTNVFTFLANNEKTVRAFMGPHGDLTFINRLKELAKTRVRHSWEDRGMAPDKFEYFFAYTAAGCIGLMEAWLRGGFQESAEEMASLADVLLLNGIHPLLK